MNLKKCAACGRAGDDAGTCGSFLTCPQQVVPVEPTDVVLQCDLCDIMRVIPAGWIMQGKAIQASQPCPVDVCQCRPIVLSAQPLTKAEEKPTRAAKKQG